MESKVTNVLISGGWGYGNLGDDAILVSTIKLLKEYLPNANLYVMSYDVEETSRILVEFEGVKVINSLHFYIDRGFSNKFFQYIYGMNSNPEAPSKWKYRYDVLISFLNFLRFKFFNYLPSELMKIFSNTDLFIQSGGGYFHGRWISSCLAHTLEIDLARKFGAKTLVIGQSIGPFPNFIGPFPYFIIRFLSYISLRNVDKILVRDFYSMDELRKAKIQCGIIPDLALYLGNVDPNRTQSSSKIVIVVNSNLDDKRKISELVMSLKDFLRENNFRIIVTVSRKWSRDLKVSKSLCQELNRNFVSAELLFHDTIYSLQNEFFGSNLVISNNLHPLVLGARFGVPGIAIVDDLVAQRKIISFMKQTCQEMRVVHCSNIPYNVLREAVNVNSRKKLCLSIGNLSNLVKAKFIESLNCLL